MKHFLRNALLTTAVISCAQASTSFLSDFDGNGAIGVIGESNDATQEGGVNVLYDFGNGLLSLGNQAFDNH